MTFDLEVIGSSEVLFQHVGLSICDRVKAGSQYDARLVYVALRTS